MGIRGLNHATTDNDNRHNEYRAGSLRAAGKGAGNSNDNTTTAPMKIVAVKTV
jgi:hypothetical protein